MKNLKNLLIVFIITLCYNANSQNIQAPYEVATWHGFTSAAICYTFDDGCVNQFDIAIPEFNKYDFKLTMFTVSDWMKWWPELKAAADKGHEVANHTKSHPHVGTLDVNGQKNEYKTCNDAIYTNIKTKKIVTMAYPYCERADDNVAKSFFVAARGCQGKIESTTPADWMLVSSIVCGSQGSVKTYSDLKNNFETAAKSKGWSVLLFHGIDDDGGYSPIPSKTLKISLEYLSMRKSKFWVTSFGNAALYAKERNCVKVLEKSSTDSLVTVQVTDTLVDSIFNQPVTIRRPLPANWPSALVKQNNDTVATRIVKVDNIVYLLFDAIPDAGDVTIAKSLVAVTPEVDVIPHDSIPAEPKVIIPPVNEVQNTTGEFKVWQDNNSLQFSLPSTCGPNTYAALYDMKGSCILTCKVSLNSEASGSISIPSVIKRNAYIIKISDGNKSWSKSIVIR